MSTLFSKILAEQSFGQRLMAMLASIYAIATFIDPRTFQRPPHPGYENLARLLEWFGLGSVAAWIRDPLFAALRDSEVAESAIWIVLMVSFLGMTAAFQRSTINIAPQATFSFLLTLTLLNDLGRMSVLGGVALLVGGAVASALFVRFALPDAVESGAAVGTALIISPILAVVYAPVRVLVWFVQEPGGDASALRGATRFTPLHVKLAD